MRCRYSPIHPHPSATDMSLELEDMVEAANAAKLHASRGGWSSLFQRRYLPQLILTIALPTFNQVGWGGGARGGWPDAQGLGIAPPTIGCDASPCAQPSRAPTPPNPAPHMDPGHYPTPTTPLSLPPDGRHQLDHVSTAGAPPRPGRGAHRAWNRRGARAPPSRVAALASALRISQPCAHCPLRLASPLPPPTLQVLRAPAV